MTFVLAEHMDEVLEEALEATGQPSNK
jgi:hypothetical protein